MTAPDLASLSDSDLEALLQKFGRQREALLEQAARVHDELDKRLRRNQVAQRLAEDPSLREHITVDDDLERRASEWASFRTATIGDDRAAPAAAKKRRRWGR